MPLSRSSMALLCVCIGLLLLVNVSARPEPEPKVENAEASTQQHFLRGNTIGAKPDETPFKADATEDVSASFATAQLDDYTPSPNCRLKPPYHCR